MRAGLLSTGSANLAHDVVHPDHAFHMFSDANHYEDVGDHYVQDHDQNMVHLRDTPNTLEPDSRRAPEVNAWNVEEIQMGKY
jgi:hypothetical protein